MANNKNPNEKQPGENPDGKYHFNPATWLGKRPGMQSKLKNRGAPHDRKAKEKPAS